MGEDLARARWCNGGPGTEAKDLEHVSLIMASPALRWLPLISTARPGGGGSGGSCPNSPRSRAWSSLPAGRESASRSGAR